MPKVIHSLSLLAAAAIASFAFAPRAHAQIETFQTLTSYNGSGIIGFTGGDTGLAQTFNDILELDSVTFRFTTTGADTVAQTFAAYVVQWSGSASSGNPLSTITAPTTVGGSDQTVSVSSTPFETFTVPPAGSSGWDTDTFQSGGNYQGYDVQLNIDQLTDPSLNYAIILVDTTNSSGLGLLDVNSNPDAFTYGYGTQNTGSGDGTLSEMESDTGAFYTIGRSTADYGFSQIVVVPAGNVIPTPEPRTAALALCAGFVGILVARRLLKKEEDALPGAMAA